MLFFRNQHLYFPEGNRLLKPQLLDFCRPSSEIFGLWPLQGGAPQL